MKMKKYRTLNEVSIHTTEPSNTVEIMPNFAVVSE